MGQGVVILCLSSKAGKIIGEIVAKKLGLSFFDIDFQIVQLLQNKLTTNANAIKVFDAAQCLAVKQALTQQNTVVCVSYDVFARYQEQFHAYEKFYMALPKDELNKFDDDDYLLNSIAFRDRYKFLESVCVKIDATGFDKERISDIIIKKIRTR